MKKLSIVFALGALPFLLVWAAWILTAFNFNPHTVFDNNAFWGMSVIYWFVYLCMIGLVVEIIDEEKPAK